MSDFGFAEATRKEPLSNSGDEILLVSPSIDTISVLNIQSSADHLQNFSRPVPALLAKRIYTVVRLKEESQQAKRYLHDVFVIEGDGARRVSHIAEYIGDMDVSPDGSVFAVITVDTSNRKMQDYRLLLYDPRSHARRYLNPKDILIQTIQLNE